MKRRIFIFFVLVTLMLLLGCQDTQVELMQPLPNPDHQNPQLAAAKAVTTVSSAGKVGVGDTRVLSATTKPTLTRYGVVYSPPHVVSIHESEYQPPAPSVPVQEHIAEDSY